MRYFFLIATMTVSLAIFRVFDSLLLLRDTYDKIYIVLLSLAIASGLSTLAFVPYYESLGSRPLGSFLCLSLPETVPFCFLPFSTTGRELA